MHKYVEVKLKSSSLCEIYAPCSAISFRNRSFIYFVSCCICSWNWLPSIKNNIPRLIFFDKLPSVKIFLFRMFHKFLVALRLDGQVRHFITRMSLKVILFRYSLTFLSLNFFFFPENFGILSYIKLSSFWKCLYSSWTLPPRMTSKNSMYIWVFILKPSRPQHEW